MNTTEEPTYQFKIPRKQKGYAQIPTYVGLDPLDKQVIREFADEMSKSSGIKVSLGNVLTTAFFNRWPKQAKKRRELERKARDERKYLDGIKDQR